MRSKLFFGLAIPLIFFFCYTSVHSQPQHLKVSDNYAQYDRDRLSPAFHKSRRDSVAAYMTARSVALFVSAPPKTRANDVSYEYHQDPNFYYLTGHIQPNAALVLYKNEANKVEEILFVDKKDPSKETWTGVRLGVEGARELLGFKNAATIDRLRPILDSLLPLADTLYYSTPEPNKMTDALLDSTVYLSTAVRTSIEKHFPKVTLASLSKVLARLRMIKTTEELDLMRIAIGISNQAHNDIMRAVHPGWYEYEIQALGEYNFTKRGAEYTGYPCIVGSGNNSTILHYETNRRQTQDGDFIEMDMGSEYHGYSADVTRSFPVNGHFTPEQKAIYDIVYEAQDSGIEAARIGNDFKAPHQAAVSVIQKGLLRLGIIKNADEYRKYFMHGTSHYLGLDVHDAGTYGPLQENMVITVEPGIYIPEGSPCNPKWWKIGCRIEDDILISQRNPIILSIGSPRSSEDVEAFMNKGRNRK